MNSYQLAFAVHVVEGKQEEPFQDHRPETPDWSDFSDRPGGLYQTQYMKGKRCSTEDKIHILRAADGGKSIVEVCKEKNISEVTFHRWK
jgi:hypothetical protein